MIRYLLVVALATVAHVAVADELKVEPDKENVVASRLEGNWQVHESLSRRLTGKAKTRPSKLSFKSGPSVAAKIPDKYAKFFRKKT